MTTPRPPAIAVSGLRKAFGRRTVLDGLDLTVPEGSVYALLGPNGAGKTTTVDVLSTLLPADAGEVRIAGHDLRREPDAVRAAIALTGQFSAVDTLLTGAENLRLMADLHHLGRAEGRRRAAELLERFDLVDAAGKPPVTYSGGMRRRLDLAMGLMARPRVVFLDEPTTGLDPRSRLGMWEFIADLVSDGTTILLTTQYLEEADRLADRMVVIDKGLVIARGTADELKAQVGGERLELTVGTVEQLSTASEVLTPLAQAVPHRDEQTRRLSMPVTGGTETLAEALRRLSAIDVQVLDIGLRRPDLDDVFLTLTGHAAEDSAAEADPDAAPTAVSAGAPR